MANTFTPSPRTTLNFTIARLAEMGPESRELVYLDGDRFCEATGEAAAARILACVNACASIPTESLTALNWQLAPVGGARPVDVAALLLKLGAYREALENIAENPFDDDYVLNTVKEALK